MLDNMQEAQIHLYTMIYLELLKIQSIIFYINNDMSGSREKLIFTLKNR